MIRKKLLTLAMAICLMLSCTVAVNAQSYVEPKTGMVNLVENVIAPYWSYTNYTNTLLSISTSGTATAVGIITGYQGITTSVSICLYLQQYKNGSWTTINSWYNSYSTYRGTLQGTASVLKGYQYRVQTSYYAYSGSSYENIVSYSSTVTY